MTPAFRNALLWVAATVLMYIAAMSSISAAYVDGHFVPDNEDAFYHARRVLDAVMNQAAVIQFDPKIHAPEGSWLNWPWGFDTLMAKITGLFGPFKDIDAANAILLNIPPVMSVLGVLLVVLIASQLALPMLHRILFTLAFALLPTAFRAFSVGNVDHHFAELLCTLGTWSAGIAFLRADNRSPAAAITFGALLGGAVALQNGLFILQVPLCLLLGLRWLQGEALPERRQMLCFSATLLAATLLVCIPSEPWRRGFFEFYTLSWFHLYVAAIVAVFSVVLTHVQRTPRNIVILVVLALAAIAPLVGALHLAGAFVTGNLELIGDIMEAKSPYQLLVSRGADKTTMYMSWWVILMFPMLLLNLWWAWRRRDPVMQYVAVLSGFGLALFQFQYRFGMFGLLPMLLTPLLAAQVLIQSRPAWKKIASVGVVAAFVLAYAPTLELWRTTFLLGSHYAYGNTLSIWPKLAPLCHDRPGVVLADIEAGHWIRYHTDCSVVANVFLLTPQHAGKVQETTHLMQLAPKALLAEHNDIRFVLVFHAVLIRDAPNGAETPVLENMRQRLPPLERDLLGPEADIPSEFEKLWEVRTPQGQIYARLYEIAGR